MSSPSAKPVIFISYSHKDRAWLDYVWQFIGSIEPQGGATIWDDQQNQIGDNWRGNILSALDACSIFILLVSNHSLMSEFVRNTEIKRVQERRTNGTLLFCPIVVTPTAEAHIELLGDLEYRPKGNKALSEFLRKPQRDKIMKGIAQEIRKQIDGLKQGKSQPIPHTAQPYHARFVKSHSTPALEPLAVFWCLRRITLSRDALNYFRWIIRPTVLIASNC